MFRFTEIEDFITDLLNEYGFDNTPETRLLALTGLKAAWDEMDDGSDEYQSYMSALNLCVSLTKARVWFHLPA